MGDRQEKPKVTKLTSFFTLTSKSKLKRGHRRKKREENAAFEADLR
ncbi:hypothetical protein VP96_02624 [Vibrio cholerae]|nr:hypothetical protein VP96_02624 [Vibrio cholerae]CSH82916.1 Uncharacterised protein [Vibrio cholerae]